MLMVRQAPPEEVEQLLPGEVLRDGAIADVVPETPLQEVPPVRPLVMRPVAISIPDTVRDPIPDPVLLTIRDPIPLTIHDAVSWAIRGPVGFAIHGPVVLIASLTTARIRSGVGHPTIGSRGIAPLVRSVLCQRRRRGTQHHDHGGYEECSSHRSCSFLDAHETPSSTQIRRPSPLFNDR